MSQEEGWGYTFRYHHYSKRWIWIWIVLGMESLLNCWDDGLMLMSREKGTDWGKLSSPSVLGLFHTTFGIAQVSLSKVLHVNPTLTDLSISFLSTNFYSLQVCKDQQSPVKCWWKTEQQNSMKIVVCVAQMQCYCSVGFLYADVNNIISPNDCIWIAGKIFSPKDLHKNTDRSSKICRVEIFKGVPF